MIVQACIFEYLFSMWKMLFKLCVVYVLQTCL